MTGPKGHPCPECGAPRGPDSAPACGCAQRAAEALRDTRTAEAAAAEDFDPLRIRPYVDLDVPTDSTMPLRPAGPEPTASGGPVTRPMRAVEPDQPGQPAWSDPSDPEDRLGEAGSPAPRRRRTLLLSTGAALAALLAAAGFASGLFSYDTPSRNGAEPQEVRESVPDVTSSAPTTPGSAPAAPPARTSAPATPSRSASPSSSPSPSASASASASANSASPTPTRSPRPTQSATRANTPAPAAPTSDPVLRPGDQGSEVTELQLRLRQINLYAGRIDGDYTTEVETAVRTYQWARGIQTDELGVYDTETRTKLESETSEP
ncbi:peptidoglycan-binding domain-containing protein [Streptomyces sp. NPDC020298]|uniref:peptidoglycan-binding domain-containing protein n=1 Tax=unclassified Streptomyces TaxID=2593676 RepID=UPI0033DF8B30